MSSDDSKIRFKNKQALKHLAKSCSENPKEKKFKIKALQQNSGVTRSKKQAEWFFLT